MLVYMIVFSLVSLSAIAVDDLKAARKRVCDSVTIKDKQK
jgi:hypothetical protein